MGAGAGRSSVIAAERTRAAGFARSGSSSVGGSAIASRIFSAKALNSARTPASSAASSISRSASAEINFICQSTFAPSSHIPILDSGRRKGKTDWVQEDVWRARFVASRAGATHRHKGWSIGGLRPSIAQPVPKSRNFLGRSLHYKSPVEGNPGKARRVVTIPATSSWQRDLQTIFHAGTLAGLSDGQLLERIAAHRGAGREEGLEVESAFALLIERHGPMVLRRLPERAGRPARGRGRVPGDVPGLAPPGRLDPQARVGRPLAARRGPSGRGLHPLGRGPATRPRTPMVRSPARMRRSATRSSRLRPPADDPRRAGSPARALPRPDRALRPGRALARRGRPAARLAAGDGQEPAEPRPASGSATAWSAAASRRASPGLALSGSAAVGPAGAAIAVSPRWPRRRRS